MEVCYTGAMVGRLLYIVEVVLARELHCNTALASTIPHAHIGHTHLPAHLVVQHLGQALINNSGFGIVRRPKSAQGAQSSTHVGRPN